MIIHNPILTGSFTVNGTDVSSITSSAASLTSLNAYTASQNNRNGTYATTGSNTFTGIQTVNSNLVVTGSITAATLVVQTITSSVVYSSGSNVFGNNIANTQVFTGSMSLTGSLTVVTTGTEFQVNANGVKFGNVIGDAHSITGSVNVSGSLSGSSATFLSSVKVASSSTGGLFEMGSGANANSRSFRLASDVNDWGDFGIQVSNSQTGTTYTNALLIGRTGAATFSSNIGVGGGTPSIFTAYSVASFGSLSTTTNGITIASTTAGNGIIEFADGVTGNQAYRGYIQYAHTTDSLIFATAGSDRLTIASTGAATFSSANQALGGSYSTTGNLLISTTDSFAINKGGSLSLGGKYNTAGAPIETFARIHGKKENSNDGDTAGYLAFETVPDATALLTERMRITSVGFLLVGTPSSSGFGSVHRISNQTAQGNYVLSIDGGNGQEFSTLYLSVTGGNYSGAGAAQWVGRNSSTLRSINAGGTVNASGADYAEYMTKVIEDVIAKGDIVGVNENGLLTNIFTDAKSFVVKSTDPSYVGGDTWGIKLEGEELEEARQKVDRIAFSGQVPCNVTGANVGDYIIPIELENGKIGGQAITNPTFEQFKSAVGKVWKIMNDGRAWIKVIN